MQSCWPGDTNFGTRETLTAAVRKKIPKLKLFRKFGGDAGEAVEEEGHEGREDKD